MEWMKARESSSMDGGMDNDMGGMDGMGEGMMMEEDMMYALHDHSSHSTTCRCHIT